MRGVKRPGGSGDDDCRQDGSQRDIPRCQEKNRPGDEPDQHGQGREAGQGAGAGGYSLAAPETHIDRPVVADHRQASVEHRQRSAGRFIYPGPDEQGQDDRRQAAFQEIKDERQDAPAFADTAVDVGRPDIAAADLADIHALQPCQEISEWDRADQVGDDGRSDDQCRLSVHVHIPDFTDAGYAHNPSSPHTVRRYSCSASQCDALFSNPCRGRDLVRHSSLPAIHSSLSVGWSDGG